MSKLLQTLALALLAASLLGASPAGAAAPVLVASDRCNGQTIDDAAQHVRDYDRHPPGNGTAQLLQRYAAIADVLSTLNEEGEILNTLCSETQRAGLFTQIAATSAWALALDSDVAARLNASCPAAAKALPAMMLSDAWLALARVVNERDGQVPAAFQDIIPKVQTRAQAVDLTLPAWADTSAYWRDQVHAKAKSDAAGCPSPAPSPTP